MKALDPYWIRIRIVIQHKMLDPDPDEVNANPQPWFIWAPVYSCTHWQRPRNSTPPPAFMLIY
jgi:hypothetical protein